VPWFGLKITAQPPRPPPTTREPTSGIEANPRQPPISKKTTLRTKRSLSEFERAILQDKSLSTYAHNVKIITRDGNVILKGPVRSIGEKRIVEGKAIAVAGEDRVRSQLQIAPK
jgi:osmotically-inducible protein OsmY